MVKTSRKSWSTWKELPLNAHVKANKVVKLALISRKQVNAHFFALRHEGKVRCD